MSKNITDQTVQERVDDAFFYHSCARCEAVLESVVDDEMRERIFEEDIAKSICDDCNECDECCVC